MELLISLVVFAFVSSITPGPNNLMLMASGANFGVRATLPHMLGVALGFTIMIVLVGAGIIQVFDAYPTFYMVLKWASAAYLLYLAVKVALSTPLNADNNHKDKPMTFFQAAVFQWVNPKAWTMALTAISLYAPDRSITAILVVAAIFGLVNLPSVSIWTVLGQKLSQFLSNEAKFRAFNIAMASLLVASVLPTLIQP